MTVSFLSSWLEGGERDNIRRSEAGIFSLDFCSNASHSFFVAPQAARATIASMSFWSSEKYADITKAFCSVRFVAVGISETQSRIQGLRARVQASLDASLMTASSSWGVFGS